MKKVNFWVASLLILIGFACNSTQESDINLFTDEQQNVVYTEAVGISAILEQEPVAQTFFGVTSSSELQSFNGPGRRTRILGNYQDPVLGKTEASVFAVARLGTLIPPDFSNIFADSMVLRLELGDDKIYGDTNALHSFEVYRATEGFDLSQNYFSDRQFAFDPTPIAKIENIRLPNTDTVTIVDYRGNLVDTIDIKASFTIPFTRAFIAEVLALDSSFFQSEEKWLNFLNGIVIKSTSTNQALVKVDFAGANSAIEFFYRKDGDFKKYNWFFTSFSGNTNFFSHDYEGSLTQQALINPDISDTILPVQALAGTNAQITFDLSDIPTEKTVVNRAVLEFQVKKDSVFDPARLLLGFRESDEGLFFELEDASRAIAFTNGTSYELFGGSVTDNGDTYKVTMNIPKYIQSLLEGERNNLIIRATPVTTSMGRSLIFGPNHDKYPMKLKLTYSIRS